MEIMTMELDERKNVDLLVNHFWKLGYFTISRRFGTYLPEPSKVGRFDVDIIAKQKNKYAIGITLTEEHIQDANLIEKLEFLATRKTKYSNSPVTLIVGVQSKFYKHVKNILEQVFPEARKNIKLMQILEKASAVVNISRRSNEVLFS